MITLRETRVGAQYSVAGRGLRFTCTTERKAALLATPTGELVVSIDPRDVSGITFGSEYFRSLKYVTATMVDSTLVLVASSVHCYTWHRTRTGYLLTDRHSKPVVEFRPDPRSPRTGGVVELVRIDRTDLALFVASLCFILSNSPVPRFRQMLRRLSPASLSQRMGALLSISS